MDDITISLKNISKSYKMYNSPAEKLKEMFHPFKKKYHRDFWALKDVSFDVKKGETLGIIGRNGSGKSTILKILCAVLQPTAGEVQVNGRISALLELGAGFNPEFTGRENVFMNGAIMGISAGEMQERFDSIASFADIGEFIDQPVKIYSSGMYVRLAFAVAINVDPDILIVDEALSVGDVRFQQKCLRKINEFREEGKTILLTTHSTVTVKSFCNRVIWINDGKIFLAGKPDDVVKDYDSFMSYGVIAAEPSAAQDSSPEHIQAGSSIDSGIEWEDVSGSSSFGEGGAEIKRVALFGKDDNKKIDVFEGGKWVVFILDIEVRQDIYSPIVAFRVDNKYGIHIFGISNTILKKELASLRRGERVMVRFEFKFPKLGNGHYSISAAIAEGIQENHIQHHWVHDACVVRIANTDIAANIGMCLLIDEADMKVEQIK